MKTLIELSEVSFTYPDGTEALIDISLQIQEGEFVVICGPTGCGKSTLLMTINGLIPHTIKGVLQGKIKVAGKDAREASVTEISTRVGTVFQNPEAQIFSLTCEDEVAFGLENLAIPHPEIKARINHVLRVMSIEGLRRRRTAELSGGEKQKLVIAATLAMGPRVLVLDEPLSDLDPKGKETVLKTLIELNKEGVTIIMAEHNLDYTIKYATRMLVMEEGKIILDDEPRRILAQHHRELARIGVRLPQVTEASLKISSNRICISAEELAPLLKGVIFRVENPKGGSEVPSLLRAQGLCYTYPSGLRALRDISFSLGYGLIALIGSNGAGKSTLARIFLGLIKPSEGDAFFKGESIRRLGLKKLAFKCGFLFQNPDLQILFDTVEDELLSCLPRSENRKKRMREILERLNLKHYQRKHPRSLSRGERQRVALATAIIRQPDVLILDEPTTGQDWRHVSELMEIAKEEARRGALILMITHDMCLVAEQAEEVLILKDGRLIAGGKPRDIFSQSFLLKESGLDFPPLAKASLLAGLKLPLLSIKDIEMVGESAN